jgi:hypothetical protein
MATLAKLVVKLVTDVSEFTSGLDSASKKLTKVGDSMINVGNKMTVGLTLPLVAAGTAAVKMASDLEESRNKANVVFGDMAKDIHKFASTAATDLGMTQNEALGFASTYGAILKNMGLGEAEVAKMSKALVQLTSDYGSFHNLSAEEAFEKIKAGLVGSSEPLRALGKDLSVSAVQSYAMANGIAASIDAMTNAELALARYGTLLEQSKDEMGDFINTSGGLANSTKILGALSQELLTSFGAELVPAVTDLINILIPLLQKFNNMDPALKKAIVQLLMVAAALGPILTVGGNVAKVLGWITKAFGAKTVAASTAAAATGKLGFSFAGLAAKIGLTGGALAGMKGTLVAVGGALGAAIGPALALGIAIAALIILIKEAGPEAWANFKAILELEKIILKKLFDNLRKMLPSFNNIGRQIMAGMINGIQSMANSFILSVVNPVKNIIEVVKRILGMHSPSKVFFDVGKNMMKGFEEGVLGNSMDKVVARLRYILKNFKEVFTNYQEGLEKGFSQTAQSYINYYSKVVKPFDNSYPREPIKINGVVREQISSNFKPSYGITNDNKFVFYGDISESAKRNLRLEFSKMFDTKFKAVIN